MIRCSFCIIISWGLLEVSLSWQVHHRGQCLRCLHYWHHHLDLLVKVAPLRLLCCDAAHLPHAPIDSQCSGKSPLKLSVFLCHHGLHGFILWIGEYYRYYLL